jgi:hypothetical protein
MPKSGDKNFIGDFDYIKNETGEITEQYIGQRGGPSFLDIQAINIAYKCGDKCPKKLKCKNHGYTNPNDCSQCLCPMGLSGTLCTEVQYSSCGAKIQVTWNVHNPITVYFRPPPAK